MGSQSAQVPATAIERHTSDSVSAWLLRTRQTAIALSLGLNGLLRIDHWGTGIANASIEEVTALRVPLRRRNKLFADNEPLAYPIFGDPVFVDPCLSVAGKDNTREARFAFHADRIAELDGFPVLELDFVDPLLDLMLTHRFTVYPDYDIVGREVELVNNGQVAVKIERILTGGLPLPPGEYETWTLHGDSHRDFGVERRTLLPGAFVVESREGFAAHQAHPWFAVAPVGSTSEEAGPVWFGELAWTGSFLITFEVKRNRALAISAGIHPFDFCWHLTPGERFVTPVLYTGFSEAGMSSASQCLHRFEAEQVLPEQRRDVPRPIQYNSWYTTTFSVDVENQIAFARQAAAIGAEVFILDDGWFLGRDGDEWGLGDWQVDRRKFPNGLDPLIQEVHHLGMSFGIWVEPEMISPRSVLYRDHPDWIFHYEGREPILSRNQLILNFARDDVRTHMLDQLRVLLRENAIDYLKWDHNRPLLDGGWPSAPVERQSEAWVRHMRGVYEVYEALNAEFPAIFMESCAGGGARTDWGILRLTDAAWIGDNADPADRLVTQFGFSRAHSAITMGNWVVDAPDPVTRRVSPLAFRFHVAMQGILGISANILAWTPDEFAEARALISLYKELRSTIQRGRQYWLLSPRPVGPAAVQYVDDSQRESVLFVYQVRGTFGVGPYRVRLRGLDPQQRYRREDDGVESNGSALMAIGVPLVDRFDRWGPALDWRSEVQVWRAID